MKNLNILAFLSIMLTSSLWGSITSTGPNTVQIYPPPPNNLTNGNLTSNTNIYVFQEKSNYTLPNNLTLDYLFPVGTTSFFGNNFNPGIVPAGTVINSYYGHYNTVGNTINSTFGSFSISLNEKIIGAVWSLYSAGPHRLDSSASKDLGITGITYPYRLDSGGGDGLDVVDKLTITNTNSSQLVSIDYLFAGNFLDTFRIITTQAPEPSTYILIGSFIGFALIIARKRIVHAN